MSNNEALKARSFLTFLNLYIKGGRGYLVANITDLMGLITPLYLYAPEEKVNSHGLYLGFEWVNREYNLYLEVAF
jgi:hypothetical protein